MLWSSILVLMLCGSWLFVSRHKHLLVMLLGMEMVMLGVFGFVMGSGFFGEGLVVLVFMVFLVCEGSVGLSILVSSVRSHGSDILGSFSLLEC